MISPFLETPSKIDIKRGLFASRRGLDYLGGRKRKKREKKRSGEEEREERRGRGKERKKEGGGERAEGERVGDLSTNSTGRQWSREHFMHGEQCETKTGPCGTMGRSPSQLWLQHRISLRKGWKQEFEAKLWKALNIRLVVDF